MIDHELVRRIFRTRLLDQTVDLPKPGGVATDTEAVAYENYPFAPPSPPSLWIRERYTKGEDRLVATNLLEAAGFMQYDVMAPSGTGTKDAEKLAQRIGDVFPAALGFADEDDTVQIAITRCAQATGSEQSLEGQVWFAVPVRITFRAYASNREV